MKFWNSTLTSMDEYIPGEQPEDLDTYIKLNTNENPFPPSEQVLNAVRQACNGDLRRYPDPTGMKTRELFAQNNGLSPEHIMIGNGSDEIFTLIFRGFIEKTGKAVFPYPSYSLYTTLAQANAVPHELVPLKKDFSLDFKSMVKANPDMIIIANPNNPTGTATPSASIESFLKSYTGLLIVDEAYVDFYGNSCIKLVKKYENCIVTRSFSKSFSLAGMRIGLAAANPDIIRGLLKIKDSYNVNTLSLAAAHASLLDEKTIQANLTMIRNNKEYLEERLALMDFTIIPSQANFIMVKHPKIPAKKLYENLKEKKILVRYFSGEIVKDYIRITIGTMMEIKKVCAELKSITEA